MSSFESRRDNQVILRFDNGNSVSTIWGFGSYSDNHFPFLEEWDLTKDADVSKIGFFFQGRPSTMVECMYECDTTTQQQIDLRFPERENPICYLSLDEWLDLIHILKGDHE